MDEQDQLIQSADEYVHRHGYDDPRQDIYVDLMNAFFAGAEFEKKRREKKQRNPTMKAR